MDAKTIAWLKSLSACEYAVAWAETQPDVETAWRDCKRADRMLWLLLKTVARERWSPAWRQAILAICACARTALRYVPDGETRPVECLETAEAVALYGDESCSEDLAAARDAAWDAAGAAAGDVAWAAALAAARAAAWDAAGAAAGDAAWAAAWDAAWAAAWAAAGDAALAEQADIVRSFFPDPPREEGAK